MHLFPVTVDACERLDNLDTLDTEYETVINMYL